MDTSGVVIEGISQGSRGAPPEPAHQLPASGSQASTGGDPPYAVLAFSSLTMLPPSPPG